MMLVCVSFGIFCLLLNKLSVLKIVLYCLHIKSFCISLINLFIFLLWCLPNLIQFVINPSYQGNSVVNNSLNGVNPPKNEVY